MVFGSIPRREELLYSQECAYCKGVGRPFVGHTKTACPVLFALRPCSLCGISPSHFRICRGFVFIWDSYTFKHSLAIQLLPEIFHP
ncbi:unnamed protein product [Angiostrongylus costaricensis]|uniref:Nanos-type domain-containing protein n=1 Tax=Angiostrongylus costaricensis TaxID=334426 RepID=A0A0R3PB32_ANGCS|nr:unnamed protein product [Angiostrongylus costaricensis]